MTHWPAVLAQGGPEASCFREVDLGAAVDPTAIALLKDTRIFELVCP